jgi:hypothetical protein
LKFEHFSNLRKVAQFDLAKTSQALQALEESDHYALRYGQSSRNQLETALLQQVGEVHLAALNDLYANTKSTNALKNWWTSVMTAKPEQLGVSNEQQKATLTSSLSAQMNKYKSTLKAASARWLAARKKAIDVAGFRATIQDASSGNATLGFINLADDKKRRDAYSEAYLLETGGVPVTSEGGLNSLNVALDAYSATGNLPEPFIGHLKAAIEQNSDPLVIYRAMDAMERSMARYSGTGVIFENKGLMEPYEVYQAANEKGQNPIGAVMYHRQKRNDYKVDEAEKRYKLEIAPTTKDEQKFFDDVMPDFDDPPAQMRIDFMDNFRHYYNRNVQAASTDAIVKMAEEATLRVWGRDEQGWKKYHLPTMLGANAPEMQPRVQAVIEKAASDFMGSKIAPERITLSPYRSTSTISGTPAIQWAVMIDGEVHVKDGGDILALSEQDFYTTIDEGKAEAAEKARLEAFGKREDQMAGWLNDANKSAIAKFIKDAEKVSDLTSLPGLLIEYARRSGNFAGTWDEMITQLKNGRKSYLDELVETGRDRAFVARMQQYRQRLDAMDLSDAEKQKRYDDYSAYLELHGLARPK